jgi:hypothetical protein
MKKKSFIAVSFFLIIGAICFAQNSNIQKIDLQGEWLCLCGTYADGTIAIFDSGEEYVWKFDGNNFSTLYTENGKIESIHGTFQLISSDVMILNYEGDSVAVYYTIIKNILVVIIDDKSFSIFRKR